MVQEGGGLDIAQLGMGWFPEQAGGLNRYYYDLFANMASAPVTLRGLVAGSDKPLSGMSEARVSAFAPLRSSLPHRIWHARRATRRLLKEFQPDVVVAHFALYAAPALDSIKNYPFVMHFHGPWADEGAVEGQEGVVRRAKRFLERSVYRQAERVVVLSKAFGQIVNERYGISSDKIVVVPGGVDLTRFDLSLSQAEARMTLDWPLDRPIVLVVRRLVRRMGLENLISSIAEVRKRVPDVLLHMVGRGPLAAELQSQIDALGLSGNVRLIGYVDDAHLPICYRAATVSVVPTLALEGFGLITLESLAAGTPVFVTPVGGLPEAVSALSSDLVMLDSSPAAICDSLTGALRGTIKLPSASECRKYVEENFAWPNIARRIVDVYQEALK